ncbi:MAG: NUDIX hydrolase [Candidatus Paceibacterota bacterium]
MACIHVPAEAAAFESILPLGLQLPVKARQFGGRNFTSLQGEVEKNESPVQTLFREAREEYNLTTSAGGLCGFSYLVSTLVPVSPDSTKAESWDYQWLHWFYLRTQRHFKPNPDYVAQFAWCAGPEQVFDVMFESRIEKLCAMAAAISVALNKDLLPKEYRTVADLSQGHFSEVA